MMKRVLWISRPPVIRAFLSHRWNSSTPNTPNKSEEVNHTQSSHQQSGSTSKDHKPKVVKSGSGIWLKRFGTVLFAVGSFVGLLKSVYEWNSIRQIERKRLEEKEKEEVASFWAKWEPEFETWKQLNQQLRIPENRKRMLEVVRRKHPQFPKTYDELTADQQLMLPANALMILNNGIPEKEFQDLQSLLDGVRVAGRKALLVAKEHATTETLQPGDVPIEMQLDKLSTRVIRPVYMIDGFKMTQLRMVHVSTGPLDAANWMARLARRQKDGDRRQFPGVQLLENYGQSLIINMNASAKGPWQGDGINVLAMLYLLPRIGYEPPEMNSIKRFLATQDPFTNGFTRDDQEKLSYILQWSHL